MCVCSQFSRASAVSSLRSLMTGISLGSARSINDRGEKYEISDNARYNLIGNGVVPQVVSGIIEKVMP